MHRGALHITSHLCTLYAMELPFFTGMATGATLIIAIGAQNAFVLTQGIRAQHRFTVAIICSTLDALLITLGVAGMGSLIEQSPRLLGFAAAGGALFLVVYGLKSLISAFQSESGLLSEQTGSMSRKQVVFTTLAITLLNPHVYLDTVVLLGAISSTYGGQSRHLFATGAITMSFFWFFLLSYGAALLAPLFKKASTWRILHTVIFLVMWRIAFSLLQYANSI